MADTQRAGNVENVMDGRGFKGAAGDVEQGREVEGYCGPIAKGAQMLTWPQKRRVFRAAWILRHESEILPDAIQPEERVQTGGRGGGRTFLEWAIDFLSCGDSLAIKSIYFGTQDYNPVPKELRKPHRTFWKEVARRGLENSGLHIADLVYGTTEQGDKGE
jgi:hypothetical protein